MTASILFRLIALLVVAAFACRKARNDWIVAKKNTSNEKKAALRRLRDDAMIGAALTVAVGCCLFASELMDNLRRERTAAARHEELRTNLSTAEIERFTKGAHYPEIRVGLYFGPHDGAERMLLIGSNSPGFLDVRVSNTNNFPIFDLEVSMWDVSEDRNLETARIFNERFLRNRIGMEIVKPDTVLSDMLPANTNAHRVGFDFNARTRSGRTTHRIRFLTVSNRWEKSIIITDDMTGELVGKEVSPGYPSNLVGGVGW